MRKVFVIIVTYKGQRWYNQCFGSLRKSTLPVQVVAVDNTPGDEDAEYIRMHFPEVHLIKSEENLGFGRANNLGMRYALENGCDFVRERWRGMTFVSADLVSVRAWKKGMELYPNNHLGWEFLAPVLYGISGGKCLYLNYPLCIQRWLYQPGYRVKWAI